jgi:Kef-type K+ transport system membrane component KefB
MDLNRGLDDLVAVALVAALAPLVVAVLPGPRIPQVVIFLVGGVLIGPHVLGVAETSNIELLSNIGLGFLFLLAGYELDPQLFRRRPGELAITGWLISGALAVGVTAGLAAAGYIRDYVPVGLALTTTALGTLLPILRDNDMLGGRFGEYIYAAGAVGELFPIVVIAVFLTQRGHFVALASVAAVGVLALALSAVPWLARSSTVQRVIQEGQDATGQITLRWAVVLLFLLLAAASRFGLDVVLGAMLAGIVLRTWTRRLNVDTSGLEDKFDAVGYGVFIPIFFISSGMTLDLKSISQDPLRLLVFFLLLLVVRGLPSLLIYRRALPVRQRVEMVFITATSLPLLIALAEIGEHDGVMLPATAAALVGAGVLSVLVYPLIAVGLHKSAPLRPTDLGITPAETAAGTGAPPEIPGPPGQDGRDGRDGQRALAAAISPGSKPSTTGTAFATAAISSTPLNEITPRHPGEMLSLMAGIRQVRNRVPVSVCRPRALKAWFGHVSGLKSGHTTRRTRRAPA